MECNGPSMEPTLFSNNILLTERITTRFYKPNRGDIVIAVSPTNPDQYICKRVIGLPGDKIITEKLTENKEDETLSKTVDKYTPTFNDEYVPKGFVWIEGDNSTNSSDSRYYGPIPLGLIRSRAICRIWPLNEIKTL
ncbi:mitochondrial inner membrane protease subunit 1 isoform X2 [Musca domestica]|uniref:Mitochondrial inner membrane protease subunit n=1 Tax=Musca domestica TaxID=7370 RepID=A0A1I8MSV5_MUSDO|nr:mitochondrial inner membrane protease subunit 1 isoform X2 [Musca domestica]